MLSTMVYADEIVDPAEIPGLDDLDDIEVKDAEKAMATQLIESLASEFERRALRGHLSQQGHGTDRSQGRGRHHQVEAADSGPTAEIVDLHGRPRGECGRSQEGAAGRRRDRPGRRRGVGADRAGPNGDRRGLDEGDASRWGSAR